MNYFANIILVACALMQSVNGVYPNAQNVANFFLRPHLTAQDPATSTNCFSNYIVKSNEISEVYSRDYKQCLLDAKADRQATDTEVLSKRIAIEKSSKNVCRHLSACDSLNTTLAVFHCHAEIGANNTKDVYEISGNASEYAIELQEKYRTIDLNYEKCCKIAERSYVEGTGANYRNLQGCLDDRIELSSSSTKTASTFTTNKTPNSITASRNIAAPASSTTEIKILPETFDTTTLEHGN